MRSVPEPKRNMVLIGMIIAIVASGIGIWHSLARAEPWGASKNWMSSHGWNSPSETQILFNQATLIEIKKNGGPGAGGAGGGGGGGGGAGGLNVAAENWNWFQLANSTGNTIRLDVVQEGTGNQSASSSAHTGTGSEAISISGLRR